MTQRKQEATNKSVNVTNSRPERVPVFQQRGSIHVRGEDPKFHYRWVNDSAENGSRIVQFLAGGYDFVKKGEVESIGDNYVFDSEFAGGSIIRRPTGRTTEGYLYYMKIPKELYLEDQRLKDVEITAREQQIQQLGHDGDENEGAYDVNAQGRKIKREIDVSSRGR